MNVVPLTKQETNQEKMRIWAYAQASWFFTHNSPMLITHLKDEFDSLVDEEMFKFLSDKPFIGYSDNLYGFKMYKVDDKFIIKHWEISKHVKRTYEWVNNAQDFWGVSQEIRNPPSKEQFDRDIQNLLN